MIKKLLLFLLILAFSVSGYYYFTNQQEQEAESKQQRSGLSKISDDAVISPINSYNGQAIWYGLSDGRLMRLDISSRKITEAPLPEVSGKSFRKIYWPNVGNDFISMGISDGHIIFNYYSFEQQKYYLLPSNILNLDWLNDGRRIVVIWKSGDGKTHLVTSNADASGYRVIRELPWADLVPKASPVNNTALLYRNAANNDINKIYLFDLENGEYSETVKEGENTGVLWLPKGDKFLYTQVVENTSQLYLHDIATKTNINLGLVTTIDKVAFNHEGTNLYAVTKQSGRETIVKLNLINNQKTTVHSLDNVSVKNLVLIGEKIFFASATDGQLYSIE